MSQSPANIRPALVSVIVPVYNVAPYLDQCLTSICQQTYPYLQIILIDDGSTDGSRAICDSWAARDPRITTIHQSNRGLSAARNVGIDYSNGDYLLFVDSDDYVREDFVEVLLAAAIGLNVNCAICGFTSLNNRLQTTCSPTAKPELVTVSIAPFG